MQHATACSSSVPRRDVREVFLQARMWLIAPRWFSDGEWRPHQHPAALCYSRDSRDLPRLLPSLTRAHSPASSCAESRVRPCRWCCTFTSGVTAAAALFLAVRSLTRPPLTPCCSPSCAVSATSAERGRGGEIARCGCKQLSVRVQWVVSVGGGARPSWGPVGERGGAACATRGKSCTWASTRNPRGSRPVSESRGWCLSRASFVWEVIDVLFLSQSPRVGPGTWKSVFRGSWKGITRCLQAFFPCQELHS